MWDGREQHGPVAQQTAEIRIITYKATATPVPVRVLLKACPSAGLQLNRPNTGEGPAQQERLRRDGVSQVQSDAGGELCQLSLCI